MLANWSKVITSGYENQVKVLLLVKILKADEEVQEDEIDEVDSNFNGVAH